MGTYAYTGYLWPAFFSTVLVAYLGTYGWRHRHMPGAMPFALACVFAVLWSVGAMLQTAAVDPSTKIFWLRFLTIWQLPAVTTATCFVVQYAGLGRWLTRRTVMLLAIFPIVIAGFIMTNDLHHLMWNGFTPIGGVITPLRGPVNTAALTYSYLLGIFNVGMLLWLFVKFPRYRWPALLMIVAQVGARILFEFGLRLGFLGQWNYGPFVLLFLFGMYGVALFRFHVFDPVPLARTAALEQMLEGMIVLDLQGQIVDANPAAQKILGQQASRLRGRPVDEVLPAGTLTAPAGEQIPTRIEMSLGEGGKQRHYTLEATPLEDRQGRGLGQMLLLQDVTERKKAQRCLVEQERMVATLKERERLARELHDGIGQVFGFLSMQAQTVRSRLRAGDNEKVDLLLDRLVQVAQDAHADVRASILDLKVTSAEDFSFIPTLEKYLREFGADHGIETKLVISKDIHEDTLDPDCAAQVLRVVQEALTNAARHGSASAVNLGMERDDPRVRITLADDGFGFDMARIKVGGNGHFGLVFMRERMAQIGGHLKIDSRPGEGTRVVLEVPLALGEGDSVESTPG